VGSSSRTGSKLLIANDPSARRESLARIREKRQRIRRTSPATESVFRSVTVVEAIGGVEHTNGVADQDTLRTLGGRAVRN